MRFIIEIFAERRKRSHNQACQRESERHFTNADRYMRHGMLCEAIRSVGLANAWRGKMV